MATHEDKKIFQTEKEAQAHADKAKAAAVPGYSEVYVSGPYQSSLDGLWHVSTQVYYG
jgi:hypothetical protein